eukprot:SAG11_NODE_491_length_8977_cov_7.387249_1_plen_72_part_00
MQQPPPKGGSMNVDVEVDKLQELADKLRSPYDRFNPSNKLECKEAFEELTKLLEDKPNRDFWIGSCDGLAM